MKYIFITGGVVSSLGKGLTSGALGALLEQRGLTTRIQKFDPYLNVDPGTMSPFQHGEVYVLDDGAETDLDLGHYERFSGVSANPYLAFFFKPTTSGLLEIKWRDDHANTTYKRGYLKVLDKNGREIYPINYNL